MKNIFTLHRQRKLSLLTLLFSLFTLVGLAQTTYYASPAGSGNGLSLLTPASLQNAVNLSIDGDIIKLANGVYSLTATLNLNRSLTIEGESEAGVVINATAVPANAWAINANKSNTTLSNFTLLPNAASGYPIHVAAGGPNPMPVLTNISLHHITINGAKRTPFDLNGVTNVTLRYLTATNSTGGNGIQISGGWNVTADHITTSGNAWGGIAVYVSKPYPSGLGRGSNNVVIDATSSSIGETRPVYVQDESGFVNTNIQVPGMDYLVKNSNLAGYALYYATKADALAVAAVLPLPASNPELSTIKQVSTGKYIIGTGMKIQTAVNAAAVNDIVTIEAGMYHEDVNINKTITLQGAGIDITTVSGVSGGGSATFQITANQVVIEGITITRDGNTVATWNNPLNSAGIAIQTVGNAEIRNCRFFGNRTAIDINNSNGNNIHHNIISDNRSGLLFRNTTNQTIVTNNFITDNWTVGILFLDASGGTNSPVQSAANSVFSNNHISGNWYGQVVDRQSGGAVPAPGTNLKQFTCNWYGSLTPVLSTGNSAEPGYAIQIPVAYGGTAVAPGAQPDILGTASANIVYAPYLTSGVDVEPLQTGFQPTANSCQSPLRNVQLTATTHISCFGSTTGSATITYEGGIFTVSYSVDGATPVAAPASPFTVNGLSAGSHTILVTDAAGNSGSVSFQTNGPVAPLFANFTFTPILCNGGMSTQNVTITGGTAPYNMTNQGGGAFVLGAAEGVTYGGNTPNTYAANYTYTVTDAKGCTYTFQANITQPDPIAVQYSATPILCNGGLSTESITIQGGTAPYTVTNQGGGALVIGAQAGVTYHGNTYAADYTYTVTDVNGCTYTFNTSITEPAPLTASAVATPIVCNGLSTVTISANGGKAPYTGTGLFQVAAGTHQFTITDANGCSQTVTVTPTVVPDTEKPTITAPFEYGVVSEPGQCGANIAYIGTPIVSDNCGILSVTNDHPSTYYPVGTTVVTWKVTDLSGNVNDTAKQLITVIDNELPVITNLPANQSFCTNGTGSYTIPLMAATDNCGISSISYTITGATNRTGTGNNASGLFHVGVSTIKWAISDAVYTVYRTTMVTVNTIPSTVITASSADAFCNSVTLTAGAGGSYLWSTGSTAQQITLGQSDGDGVYSVTVTVNGCTSAPATYTYQKQNLVSSYTILAEKEVKLGENNKVNSGSVGVRSVKGEAEFRSNSSVSSPGSFVKAARINKKGWNIAISHPIYSAATGISLPAMHLNNTNTNYLPNRDVAANSISTVTGNYKNLILKKGSRTIVTGNLFGSIRVEQGAQVTFTSATVNMNKLEVVKGPRNGYSYVRFSGDTRVLVSGSVTVGSQVYINPDNHKVTFYMGDNRSDEEKFTVKGGDTKVTANIYIPNGKLKVTGGYSYGNDNREHDEESCYGQGNSYVNMTGLFIAEEVEGNGKNVIWNSFTCGSAPAPVLNYSQSVTQTVTGDKSEATTEEALQITVLPNPSTTYFTLKLSSRYTAPVTMRVVDESGRVVDTKSGIGANSTIQIGHAYLSGTYFAEMTQGTQRKLLKLIKIR